MDERTWRYVRWMLALFLVLAGLAIFNVWMFFRG